MKYNVGDKVRIKSIDWYNSVKDEFGCVSCETYQDCSYYFEDYQSEWCGKIMTISYVCDGRRHHYIMKEDSGEGVWTDKMIDCLAEEDFREIVDDHYFDMLGDESKEIVPKFKVGDIIGKVNSLTSSYLVTSVSSEYYGLQMKDGIGVLPVEEQDEWVLLSEGNKKIEGLVEEETYDFLKTDTPYPSKPRLEDFLDMLDSEINLPEGYEFRDENGNIINVKKIVLEKKKPKYPQSYEECCNVLNLGEDGRLYTKGYNASLIQSLQKLLICRDAYWKIAGEEMGSGKPWEPNFKQGEGIKYTILFANGKVIWNRQECVCTTGSRILAFPTEEMRDAFYEAFKELIEECKELL